jgi:hypothetical protein
MAIAGCDHHRTPGESLGGVEEELPILASYSGSYSNLKREARVVIYDQSTLNLLPIETRPVDFEREMVLFAGLGPTPSPDYGIAIERVEKRERRIHVHVVRSYPPPDHGLTPGLASPFCAVILPRSEFIVSGFDGRWPAEPSRSAALSRP